MSLTAVGAACVPDKRQTPYFFTFFPGNMFLFNYLRRHPLEKAYGNMTNVEISL
jgi:hypothetical protein